MSHASLLVSPTKQRISELGLEAAISWEMAPFDENRECFRDGSRWDWYQVGGRYTGHLDGYDPETDPQNIVTCNLCEGTGKRLDMTVANGCNVCKGTGKHVQWPTQWKKHNGDILQVSLVDPTKFRAFYAFLRDRHWHEAERLGWFGVPTATECERKDPGNPDSVFGKCLHKDEESGARVICWNEPWEVWEQKFYQRFVANLGPEERLVVVDYHV